MPALAHHFLMAQDGAHAWLRGLSSAAHPRNYCLLTPKHAQVMPALMLPANIKRRMPGTACGRLAMPPCHSRVRAAADELGQHGGQEARAHLPVGCPGGDCAARPGAHKHCGRRLLAQHCLPYRHSILQTRGISSVNAVRAVCFSKHSEDSTPALT